MELDNDLLMYVAKVRHYPYIDWDGLIDAAIIGDLNLVKYFISQGANIHINDDEALRYTADEGHIEIVKYLVKQGANISKITNEKEMKYYE